MKALEYYLTCGVLGFCGGLVSSEIVKYALGRDIISRNIWLYFGVAIPLMLLINYMLIKFSGLDKIGEELAK